MVEQERDMEQGATEKGRGATSRELTARDLAVLDFERDFRAHEGGKLAAITARFDISPARYYQLLGRLIDSDAAAAVDPLLIRRLRKRRAARGGAEDTAPLSERADGTRGASPRNE